jgi:hypothetical protein
MKNLESMESSKKQTQYNDDATTIIHRRVKKEAEAEGPTMYHNDGKYNFNNKNGVDNHCNLNHHEQAVVLPAKVKKEEEGNNNKNDDHDQESEEDVWTNRWLPPTTANNTLHSVKSEEKANDDTEHNARNPEEIGSATTGINGVAATTATKRQRRRYRSMPKDDNDNGDDNDNENNQQDKGEDEDDDCQHDYVYLYPMAAEGDDDGDGDDDDGDADEDEDGNDYDYDYDYGNGNGNGNMNDDDDDDDNESKPPAKKKMRRHRSNDPFTNPVEGIDDNDDDDDDDDMFTDPRESDVLCGRGGSASRHPGNLTYRGLVNSNQGLYITCLKTEKNKISRSIVAFIREQRGRFLERDAKTGVWIDIGDKKAIKKTSHALREGQSKLRKKMVELKQIPSNEYNKDSDHDDNDAVLSTNSKKGNQNQNQHQNKPRPKTPIDDEFIREQYLLNESDKEQIQIQHKKEQLMSISDSPNSYGNCGINNDRDDNTIDNNTNKHEYYERQQQQQQQYNDVLIQQQQQKKATATAAVNALATSVIAANDRNDNTIDSNTNEHEYFKRQQQPQQQYNDFLIQQQLQEKTTAAINENQNQNQVQNQTQMRTQLDSDDDDDNNAVSSTKSKKGEATSGRCTSLHDKRWDENFQCLVAYKKKYNSTTVPQAYKVNDLNLGIWVRRQRTNFRNDKLSVERTNRLKSIKFVWKITGYRIGERSWDEYFQCLVAYKKEYNSTTVPKAYKVNDLNLGIWVNRHRTYFKNNELSEERINHLESIGFVWDNRDAQWMGMYKLLVAYKKQHKSTNVPHMYKTDPKFGPWVSTQKYAYIQGNLSEKRLTLLNAINFDCSAQR